MTNVLAATAPAHRAFHMVPLWMLLLHVVSDPRMPPSGQAVDALVRKLYIFIFALITHLFSSPLLQLKRIRTHLEKCSAIEKGLAASLFGSSPAAADALAPQVEMAARSTLLYLDRILMQKRARDRARDGSAKAVADAESSELLAKLHKLLALADDPRYSKLEEFFSQAATFLSPLCELPTFEQALAESLFPMAPYLAKVMSK